MADIELDPESDLSENGVEDEARLKCSPMLVEVLRYILKESEVIENLDDAIQMKFDEDNAVLICDAIVNACNTNSEDDDTKNMREFFKTLSIDAEIASSNLRYDLDYCLEGEFMPKFCEWSVQMSHSDTVCHTVPYWEAVKSYDLYEEADADYEIKKDLGGILSKVLQHLDESAP